MENENVVENEIELKGKYYYSKNESYEYKNYQIIKSTILNKNYDINWIKISKLNTHMFIYHSYETIDKSHNGRWYNKNIKISDFNWDNSNKQISYFIPEYEEEIDNNIKILNNIPVVIKFNNIGWGKIKKIFNYQEQ